MRSPRSPFYALLQAQPDLHPQRFFKSSLTALSHAIEDLVLVERNRPLVIANFQRERFYRQETRRYQQIAQLTDQVYVLAAPESDFAATEAPYITIPFDHSDDLAQEWHLVVVGQEYTACIACREHFTPEAPPVVDQARQFEGIWSFDRQISSQVAQLLLERVLAYRPELGTKVEQARTKYGLTWQIPAIATTHNHPEIDPVTFTQRLVTYLQASQYRLLKAHRLIAAQERQERLVNSITTAIRHSLNPQEVLKVAVRELGQTFDRCRCLLYRCDRACLSATIEYEAIAPGMLALKGENWLLADNPLFQAAAATEKAIAVADVTKATHLQTHPTLKAILQQVGIRSWLLVPIVNRETMLGMLELHYGGTEPYVWQAQDIALVEAIATAVGVALIQAQAYTRLEELNGQLAALERTRSNLIAIVGHELRTPLSTIQICLETLATEPQTPPDVQQVMLQTALTDTERLRQLTQDFLTLSRLESGQINWQIEPISVQECLDLALNSLKSNCSPATLAQLELNLPANMPLVLADGEGLVQVLIKILDNAFKFTKPDGKVTIRARTLETMGSATRRNISMLEVTVADTGRGIETSQLEMIFDRFSQAEGYLRRITSGTGLGLAICRQIIQTLGGQIWAESSGKNRGSQFHFTLPIE
jgi:DICT domain-containing protein/nitrogen-specific signal transduction histidine kinase